MKLALRRVVTYMPKDAHLKIFQDGAVIEESGQILAPEKTISKHVSYFQDQQYEFYASPFNVGVAEMYSKAEKWAFEEIQADVLYFVEDDLYISPFFFWAMKQLADIAIKTDRVGLFSAYGDSSISKWEQFRRQRQFVPMHHLWGYGLTRKYWLKTVDKYATYLNIMAGTHYRSRPNTLISEYLSSLTPNRQLSEITSQDGARLSIMHSLNSVGLMCTPSHVLNIGKRGLHCTPAWYHNNIQTMKGSGGLYPFWAALPGAVTPVQIEQLMQAQKTFAYN